MRDILTIFAGIVLVVLAAAVIAPPLLDWDAQRGWIDDALTRAAGIPARTEGAVSIRLLPSPRIQVDQVRLGSGAADEPSFAASEATVEIALFPLLRGEIRFTEARIGRAELRLPTTAAGGFRLRPEHLDDPRLRRELAIEDLTIGELLVTTSVPTTGRTDQFHAEQVRVEARSLAGPWRIDGLAGAAPFRLSVGELAPDRTVQLKLAGGGDVHPRFDIDARMAFVDAAGGLLAPEFSGQARIQFGPPGQAAAAGLPIAVSVQTAFKTGTGRIELDPFTVETGEGTGQFRLSGKGSLRFDDPRLTLKLEGKRLDIDTIVLSPAGRQIKARAGTAQIEPARLPIDLEVSIASVTLATEELSNVQLQASIEGGTARIGRLELIAPGQTRVAAEGEIGFATRGGLEGKIAIASAASDRFGRYLSRLDLDNPFLRILDGRPLEASADISVSRPIAAVRNVRVKIGEALLTGSARYTAPEGQARGRLEAQIGVQGIDLAQLPQISSVFDASRDLDIGLILDARDVRHEGRPGAGRIAARILSDGPQLLVEALEIVDLAGANARVSGRIAPDGSGRIEGTVTAPRAAPLIDLIGRLWIGGVTRFVPYFLREGEVRLDVTAERPPSEAGSSPRLRTTLKGIAAGGPFEAEVLSNDGRTESLDLRLSTENAGTWVDRPQVAILKRPARLELRGVRLPSGAFNATIAGDVGGLRIRTSRAFDLGRADDVIDSGEAEFTSDDVTPFLVLLGDGAGVQPPVPARVRLTLGRTIDSTLVNVAGVVAGSSVQGRLAVRSRSDLDGELTLDRLSLPWLAAALALNAAPTPNAAASWSTTRFGQSGRLIGGGTVKFTVRQLQLGRGFEGRGASFVLGIRPDGIEIRDLSASLAGGRLAGRVAINRQGTLGTIDAEGTIENADLAAIIGGTALKGRLGAELRVGGSGESIASILANLGGSGTIRVPEIEVPAAAPAALDRAVPRILADSEPLAARRIETIVAEELQRGPFRARNLVVQATLVGGSVRLAPLVLEGGAATWRGSAAIDLRGFALDARGTLTAKTASKEWTGTPPFVLLGWRGTLSAPVRELDAGPLTNGVAAIVLKRELEKIEAFEIEANERTRLAQRVAYEKTRREERERFAKSEQERLERERLDRERQERERRVAEEAARKAAEEAARRAAIEEARRAAIEEARRREEEARRVAAEDARRRQEEARRVAEEAARKAAEEAARKATEEAARKVAEEAARKATEEAARKVAEEAARKVAEEAARQAAEEAARKATEEAARRTAVEAARLREEGARRAAAEDLHRREEESRRVAAEEARRREDEARRVAAEEARRREEDAARRAAEETRRREQEAARRLAEEARRRAAEEAARRAVDEAARRAVEESRRREEARRREEEAARRREAEVERARARDTALPPPIDIRPPAQLQPGG